MSYEKHAEMKGTKFIKLLFHNTNYFLSQLHLGVFFLGILGHLLLPGYQHIGLSGLSPDDDDVEAPAKAGVVACTDKRVSLAICSFKLILLYNWLTDELLDTVQLDAQNGPLIILLGEAW